MSAFTAPWAIIMPEETENRSRELPVCIEIIRPDDLARTFNGLADRWERATGMYSSPTKRFSHPDYQAVIDMGPQVIPMILQRLKDKPDDWFFALKRLADGHDAAQGIDNFDDAVEAWLEWGRIRGLIE